MVKDLGEIKSVYFGEERAMAIVTMTDPTAEMSRPMPFHGLTELVKRKGWRNLKDTERGGSYLSERSVFRDTATGYIAWRLTCDPAVNVNDYYDIPAWNADGSVLGFLTRRRGGHERWLMDANGDNLRPMPTPDGKPIGKGYWSMQYRDRFYHALKDAQGTHVVSNDPFTGEQERIVSVDRDLGDMMPPHPSEEFFLFGTRTGKPRPGQAGAPSTAYVVGGDGTVQEVHFEKRWHRLRFTKAADRRLFFNFDDPRTQWTILPDGTDRKFIPDSGSHPDWQPDGGELTYYHSGSIWGIRYDGTGKRCVIDLGAGGHGGPCLDGEWFVSDTHKGGKYPGGILYFRTDGSEICHTVFTHMSSFYAHEVQWHPDHHSSHPHPNASPDGTKTIFNSDFLQEYSDIYIVVNRLPDPPRDLKVRRAGSSVVLNWTEPEQCRETRGYYIYRSSESEVNYERMIDEPVVGTEWRGPAGENPGSYAVTAVEWSGLESEPSNEALENDSGNREEGARLTDGGASATGGLPALDETSPKPPMDVTVSALSPNTLKLSWLDVEVPDLDHYNVYCGREGDFACEQASLIGSPSGTEFVDWGLELNATYGYRVTAVDRAGNESEPTDAVEASTPAFEPVRVELKSEDARTAEGGVAWTFELEHDDEYAIWGYSMYRKDERSVFELTIDDGPTVEWQVWGRWDAWYWSPVGNRVTGSPQVFELKAGTHTLRAQSGTLALQVAEIVVTNDPSWWPVEGMRDENPR